MLVEIAGDELYFQTISRTGLTVDSGVIPRVEKISGAASRPAVQIRNRTAGLFRNQHTNTIVPLLTNDY
jgi:hypothetical protein